MNTTLAATLVATAAGIIAWFSGLARAMWPPHPQLEPVINFRVGGAGSQFFRVQGVRSDEDWTSASDEGRRNRENWPQPSGLRRKSGHTALSSSPWNSQSLRPPPCLARFSLATPPTGKLITGSRRTAHHGFHRHRGQHALAHHHRTKEKPALRGPSAVCAVFATSLPATAEIQPVPRSNLARQP